MVDVVEREGHPKDKSLYRKAEYEIGNSNMTRKSPCGNSPLLCLPVMNPYY